jgi:FtsP/CotA-like multicopper oxidase with cupredoxin domain
MRIPVLVALAVPVVLVSGAAAVYSVGRPASGQVRTYYISADEVTAEAPATAEGAAGAPGTRYVKARYREYTDASFSRQKPRPAEWQHLAFLGPLIRADVGDTIRIVFRNRVGFPVNVHPDPVLHRAADARASLSAATTVASDGLGWDGDDAPVPPGGSHTYSWAVPAQAGPGADDHGSVLWLYHSHTGQGTSDDAGLIGPIIVYKRGALR